MMHPAHGALVVLAFLLGCVGAAEPKDDLPAGLRRRVERLKGELPEQPTTAENVADRAALLWEWANARALGGATLPVNLPTRVAAVVAARVEGRTAPAGLLAEIDGFLRELALSEDEPDALGPIRFAQSEPLVAGSWTTLEQTYTVGSRPLEPGAVLVLGVHIMCDQSELQYADPAGDGFVSMRSSVPGARFEGIRVPMAGMHGSYAPNAQGNVAFVLRGDRLGPGATVTAVYGDRSAGSRGLQVQTFATDEMILPIYIGLEGSGHLLTPRWPALEVVGRPELRSLRVTVPSIVVRGEPFEVAVASLDGYLNRTTAPTPAFEVLLDDEPWGEIDAGRGPLAISPAVLDDPGVHRFTVRTRDGFLHATSNPVRVDEAGGERVFWGELNGHSRLANGQGTPERYFHYGRDDARLDFLTLAEYDSLMNDAKWRELQELTRRFHEEGRFLAFLGYEWTPHRRLGGHHIVLFRDARDRQRVGIHSASSLDLFYAGLRAQNDSNDVLVIPHAHMAADWSSNDPDLERLVQIASLHGTFEWFGNRYLRNGFRLGFVAATDDHRAAPGSSAILRKPFHSQRGGIAAVWAPEKTGEAVFSALRGRRTYATSGERILLDATLNGYPMGSVLPDSTERRIVARVAGTAPIDRLYVIRNGDVIWSRDYASALLGSHAWIRVAFYSSSEVFGEVRDNPRPFRPWRGTIDVEGAEVVSVRAIGFDNHYTEQAVLDSDRPQRVSFYTETRGRADSVLVELQGARAGTVLRFHLESEKELGNFADLADRGFADVPEARFELALGELGSSGRYQHQVPVGEHPDRVEIQLVDLEAPLDRELGLTDVEGVAPGDYYYVRVDQIDGGQAWSSPFWVGGAAVTERGR